MDVIRQFRTSKSVMSKGYGSLPTIPKNPRMGSDSHPHSSTFMGCEQPGYHGPLTHSHMQFSADARSDVQPALHGCRRRFARIVHAVVETICHCVAGIQPTVRDPPRDTGWRSRCGCSSLGTLMHPLYRVSFPVEVSIDKQNRNELGMNYG